MLLVTARSEDDRWSRIRYLEMIEDMERELNKVIEDFDRTVNIVILTHNLPRPGERRRLLYLVRESRNVTRNREYVARR